VTLGLVLGIGLAGGVGAVARFVVDGAVATRAVSEFPLGTFVVNLSGAFALGVVAGAALDDDVYRLVATGLLGGYTTFSTWMFESQRLGEDGELGLGLVNVVAPLVLGVIAVWAGRAL
jgi:CrcB protein